MTHKIFTNIFLNSVILRFLFLIAYNNKDDILNFIFNNHTSTPCFYFESLGKDIWIQPERKLFGHLEGAAS